MAKVIAFSFQYLQRTCTIVEEATEDFYGVSLMPLVNSLEQTDVYRQMWYADDPVATCELNKLFDWLTLLIDIGPKYGD